MNRESHELNTLCLSLAESILPRMVQNHYAVVYVLTSGASVTILLTWRKVWSTLQLVLDEDWLDRYVQCNFVLFHLCAPVIQKSAQHVSRSAFTLYR